MYNEKHGLSESSKIRLNSIMETVLNDFKPSKEEVKEAEFAINEVMGRLKGKSPKYIEIILAGSVARGTQIKGNSDIDVFLLFPRKMKEELIEKKGLEIAKSIVNKKKNESFVIKYAEHPYTRVFFNDLRLNVDIVPAYKITDAREIGTAVDRTQLHNEFVNSNLTGRQRDEVRILKVFLKMHHIYGAEARVEGFSGYLCELLIYHYGSFIKLITAIANSKMPIIITNTKYPEPSQELIKKFSKNLIVLDPTDKSRNVAANVSDESLLRFVLISRKLLKNPTKEFFYSKSYSELDIDKKLTELRKRLGTNIYLLHFGIPDIAQDITWQQLKKTKARIENALKENGFDPVISLQNIRETDGIIGFLINDTRIDSRRIIGPGIEMHEAAEKFLKAHQDSISLIENGRIYVIEKSKYSSPEELIPSIINSRAVKLPSYLNPRKFNLYINKVPKKYAALLYEAYFEKISI